MLKTEFLKIKMKKIAVKLMPTKYNLRLNDCKVSCNHAKGRQT